MGVVYISLLELIHVKVDLQLKTSLELAFASLGPTILLNN